MNSFSNFYPAGYPEFGKYLNQTGRPIVYSCSWPAYASSVDIEVYKDMAKHCNLWRNWNDIGDSWRSVKSIINWFATNQVQSSKLNIQNSC